MNERFIQLLDRHDEPIGVYRVLGYVTDEQIQNWYKEFEEQDEIEEFDEYLEANTTEGIERIFLTEVNVLK